MGWITPLFLLHTLDSGKNKTQNIQEFLLDPLSINSKMAPASKSQDPLTINSKMAPASKSQKADFTQETSSKLAKGICKECFSQNNSIRMKNKMKNKSVKAGL